MPLVAEIGSPYSLPSMSLLSSCCGKTLSYQDVALSNSTKCLVPTASNTHLSRRIKSGISPTAALECTRSIHWSSGIRRISILTPGVSSSYSAISSRRKSFAWDCGIIKVRETSLPVSSFPAFSISPHPADKTAKSSKIPIVFFIFITMLLSKALLFLGKNTPFFLLYNPFSEWKWKIINRENGIS